LPACSLVEPGALPAYTKAQVGNGLRADAFVFASFNQPFKISPRIWGVWMRLLVSLPKAQLWVTKLNEGAQAEEALRREAMRSGVSADQLVFTGTADLEVHVHYKSAADLFLDTDLYNAHSTAADVLFAGVPILTLAGSRMSARIASSIASAGLGARAGGHVMVARDLEDYFDIAYRLATQPFMYEKTRSQLIQSRCTCALYDAERWVREWERGIRMLWESRDLVRDGDRRSVELATMQEHSGEGLARHSATGQVREAAISFHVIVSASRQMHRTKS
jgi:protein O-GlcNAc transferase